MPRWFLKSITEGAKCVVLPIPSYFSRGGFGLAGFAYSGLNRSAQYVSLLDLFSSSCGVTSLTRAILPEIMLSECELPCALAVPHVMGPALGTQVMPLWIPSQDSRVFLLPSLAAP